MRKSISLLVAVVFVLTLAVSITGCGPAQIQPIKEIETNETAFLVPLEGASKADQGQFMSIEYLEQAKIATKRITIPVRKRKIGRGYWRYEWLPTLRIITVNRAPVTREWTAPGQTGTSRNNEAIAVESLDSIGFSVGVNITCFVAEHNAAQFLYYYAGQPLDEVIDTNIRGSVQTYLSKEFGSRILAGCKTDKKEIFDGCFTVVKDHFAEKGITVDTLGYAEGLSYDDKEIQDSINGAYIAEMDVQKAKQEKLAQDQRNELMIAMAVAERKAAEEFALAQGPQIARVSLEIKRIMADAALERATSWDGKLPSNMMPAAGNYLFDMALSK